MSRKKKVKEYKRILKTRVRIVVNNETAFDFSLGTIHSIALFNEPNHDWLQTNQNCNVKMFVRREN